jgi:hypothetical protein
MSVRAPGPSWWPAGYVGQGGALLALLIVVGCLVLWLTGRMDPVLAVLIGLTALTRLI